MPKTETSQHVKLSALDMKLTRTDALFSASALTGETPSLSSLIETKAFDALHELRFHLWIDSALSQAYHSPSMKGIP